MRILTVFFAIVLMAGLPGLGAAQTTLTLDQAILDALARNRALLAARSSVDAAEAGAAEARSNRLPQITVAESWQRGDQPVFVFGSLLSARRFAAENFAIDALNHPDPVGFFRTTVGVEQVVFDGGQAAAASETATLQIEMASLVTAQAAADLQVSVTEAYGRVLAAQAARRAAEAGVAATREDLTRAERRRDQGLLSEADVLAFAVRVAELEERVLQATGETAAAMAELSHLMGAPITRDYAVAEPPLPPINVGPDLQALLAQARESRPVLQQAKTAVRIADVARNGARGALLPRVAAQAAVDLSGTHVTDRASSWIVGGELRWTFGVGGRERARARGAAAAAAQARLEQAEADGRVEVEVVSALRRFESARARQAVGTAAVEQARESQRIIRDRFEAGLAGTDDVLRASATMLDADTRRTAALVDALVAKAMLDRAVGRSR